MSSFSRKHILSLIALLALIFGLAACGAANVEPLRAARAPAPPADRTTTNSATTNVVSPASGPVLGRVEIHSFDLGFKPAKLSVEKPGRYTVKFINDGAIQHDVTFANGTKLVANASETKAADLEVPADGLNFFCSIPGHADAGMKGLIAVAGASAGAMTVAPGFVQHVWTFNGTVPGPVIRVHVGDTIRIHLKNPATNQLAHSVDFHASQVAWNDEMTSINPGEEKLYEWQADYAGVWMYHCGTSPALHHIANGMYGMVIVEPKEGLPKVDKEFALVQSEWYLGPQGQPVSLAKASAAAPAPDFVVFNGVANQYKDNPLKVGTGEKVRIFVLNAGPSVDSSFHIVGTIFNTVIKEGVALTPDNPGHYGAQAVDLSPAQGAIVEFTTAEDGMYPIVTHAFNFVGHGALGLVQAGDGDPKK